MSKKGAHRAHAAKGRLKEKNSRQAAMMKKLGVCRTQGRCSICNKMVSLPIDHRHVCR